MKTLEVDANGDPIRPFEKTASSTAKILNTIEADLWRRLGEYAKLPNLMSNEGIYNLLSAIAALEQVRCNEDEDPSA